MQLQAINLEDFYKSGHIFQYPTGTEYVYSNWTPRSARHANFGKDYDNKVVVFGYQGFIQEFLVEEFTRSFFGVAKDVAVRKYKRRLDNALGKDSVSMAHIEDLHDLGFLPLCIKAIKEGSRVNIGVPQVTIINTLPNFYWLTNFIETLFSCESWKPATVATIADQYKRLLTKYAELTGAPIDFVMWQGHGFEMRGMSGVHDAAKCGAGHLLSFFGTDTIPAIDYLEEYYLADSDKELIGGSVPATEHSVMCAGGKDDELETYRRLIQDVYPSGIVSIVSDTWDFWKVMTETSKTLKDTILMRLPNGLGMAKVVFRPDSGDPVKILVGEDIPELKGENLTFEQAKTWAVETLVDEAREQTPHGECGPGNATGLFRFEGKAYEVSVNIEWNRHDKEYYYLDGHSKGHMREVVLTPAQKGAVECLWEVFGGTTTDKGYKVLHERVGLIYGDSITLDRADRIMSGLMDKGFASCNTVLGIGSYTYQYLSRDTLGWAVKATGCQINGEMIEMFKDPVTDSGTKKSAKGFLKVTKDGGEYRLLDQQKVALDELMYDQDGDELKVVFYNGKAFNKQPLAEVRAELSNTL